MDKKQNIKSIELALEGNISEARKIAKNIIDSALYSLIPDWKDRSEYIEESLKMATYNGQITKLYYEFAPIQQPTQPESNQEA